MAKQHFRLTVFHFQFIRNMIDYEIILYNNTEQTVYTLLVKEPLTELSVIASLWEDLADFIKWLEELISKKIPDFSEEGGILDQGILWGSNKSRIIDYASNTQKAEFDTMNLLQLCKEWQKFITSAKK